MCDYTTGFTAPEMVKRRPVVVLSPRARRRPGPYLVVPFSTTAPLPVESYHVRLPVGRYAFFRSGRDVWAKCDMVSAVSAQRLDRLRVGGAWMTPAIRPEDLAAVQRGVLHALGLSRLTAAV